MTFNPVADTDQLRARILDDTPFWAQEFATIVDKRGRKIPFTLKPGQLAADAALETQRAEGKPQRMICLKARQVGFCLDPSTRVLTADLRWVPIDSLRPGQELVSTDEMPAGGKKGRRLRRAVLQARNEVFEEAYRLEMSNGQTLIATGQHRFLSKRRGSTTTTWRRVEKMREGDPIRHITEPWGPSEGDDRWVGGIIDGEGCLRAAKGEVTISQCAGPVYDTARLYLEERGYTFREDVDHRTPEDSSKLGERPVGRLILGRLNELFRLVGQTRPVRFVDGRWWEGRELPGKRSGVAWATIERIVPLGKRRMIDIQTSTQTFIAEGFVSHNSTLFQAKLLHRCTLRERYDVVTVAHDKETAGKLSRMGETIYGGLPEDEWLKPDVGSYGRRQFMHFTGGGDWKTGDLFPDSRYTVDTAGEFQAGRGGTYRAIHASEVAFWTRINEKLTALMAAVPDDPDTLFVLESTANGFNEFKDWWDDAEAGRSDWIPFFWPWWKEEEYSRDFASETERERFIVGDPNDPYAEEEPELIAVGEREGTEITLEQLYWRRTYIANKCGGDIRIFHQEMPATAEQAFISSGQKVFDPYRTRQIIVKAELTDPRVPTEENPGPRLGDLVQTEHRTDPTRSGGTIEVPTAARWVPRERGVVNPKAPWKLWLPGDPQGEYVMGVDVSGGITETTKEPDYHAIEVIDLETREQVAEYHSRIEPMLLAREILLAAIYFNQATVAIERTGSWGVAPLQILWHDYHYPHVYRSRKAGATAESVEKRLGWDTNVKTKPLLIAGMSELIRLEEDGVKSRALADEIRTYTRNEKGGMEAEPGRYDDLLMAYMIAQEVARGIPLRSRFTGPTSPTESGGGFTVRAGVGAYDSRY